MKKHYLLDTNICIYIMKAKPPEVLAHLVKLSPTQISISSITVMELYYGVENSAAPKQNRLAVENFLRPFTILDFTTADAKVAARIRVDLKQKGTPIGAYDLQIAAMAVAQKLIVVTNNTKEFARVNGLLLENWVSSV